MRNGGLIRHFFFCFMLLAIGLLCVTHANGEIMHQSRHSGMTVIQWENQVMVVDTKNQLFSNNCRLFTVTPDDCRCLRSQQLPFYESLQFHASRDVILKVCVYSAVPLSYSTLSVKYSYCKASDWNGAGDGAFIDLPAAEKEIIKVIDGVIVKYCENHNLLRFDTDNNTWKTIDVEHEDLWSSTDAFYDSCICLDRSKALFYSPELDKVYQFPAAKEARPWNLILHQSQLIYADDGGIFVCSESDAASKTIISSGPDFDIGEGTTFFIADNILYISDFHDTRLARVRLDNHETLPAMDIKHDDTGLIIHDGYLYTVERTKDDFHSIDCIKVIDLKSDAEVKSYSIR